MIPEGRAPSAAFSFGAMVLRPLCGRFSGDFTNLSPIAFFPLAPAVAPPYRPHTRRR